MDREVARRLDLPEYRELKVEVVYERTDQEIHIRIRDQGAGFDWQNYASVEPSRVFDSHGRGIAVAQIMSFDRVEYFGNGNEVMGVIRLT